MKTVEAKLSHLGDEMMRGNADPLLLSLSEVMSMTRRERGGLERGGWRLEVEG